jgi:hypothetical protein
MVVGSVVKTVLAQLRFRKRSVAPSRAVMVVGSVVKPVSVK